MPRLAAALPACLFILLAGCAPSKGDIEKSIKDEMKTQLNVEITAIDLTKQPDGGYVGTATAANGDVYDVSTDPPKGGKAQWRAILSQGTIEKSVRQMLDEKLPSKVKALALTKQGAESYSGTADLENGLKLNVTAKLEGGVLNVNWKQAEP